LIAAEIVGASLYTGIKIDSFIPGSIFDSSLWCYEG
jgi:hypothetical protein